MNWKRIANLAAAFAIALGSHYVDVPDVVEQIADVAALTIAQNNRELRRPKVERRHLTPEQP